MIRARFFVPGEDYRPVIWPVKHPYWCTGVECTIGGTRDRSVVVAYADDEAEIRRLWPDAEDIDVHESDVKAYAYTSRFPKPDWMP